MRLGVVCGSFHREEVEKMLDFASDEASIKNWEVAEVSWVPGSMEAARNSKENHPRRRKIELFLGSPDLFSTSCPKF